MTVTPWIIGTILAVVLFFVPALLRTYSRQLRLASAFRAAYFDYSEKAVEHGAPQPIRDYLDGLTAALYQRPFLNIFAAKKFVKERLSDLESRAAQTIELAKGADNAEWVSDVGVAGHLAQHALAYSIPFLGTVLTMTTLISSGAAHGIPQARLNDIFSLIGAVDD